MAQFTLPIYTLAGKSDKTITLNEAIFGVPFNADLLHQAVVGFLANRRATTAHTKDRSEVSGGGRKPWRQKGTGNARQSSTRSPIWRGGGITFGPRSDRNYSVRLPQKMRQGALKVALSDKLANENLLIIDSVATLDGKTKSWAKALDVLPKGKNSALIVSADMNDMADRSIRNIEKQKYVTLNSLTIFDVTRFHTVILTTDAVEGLTARLTGTAKAEKAAPASKAPRAKAVAATGESA